MSRLGQFWSFVSILRNLIEMCPDCCKRPANGPTFDGLKMRREICQHIMSGEIGLRWSNARAVVLCQPDRIRKRLGSALPGCAKSAPIHDLFWGRWIARRPRAWLPHQASEGPRGTVLRVAPLIGASLSIAVIVPELQCSAPGPLHRSVAPLTTQFDTG
jgi:hypothetical protein